jgi:hypothetical protein
MVQKEGETYTHSKTVDRYDNTSMVRYYYNCHYNYEYMTEEWTPYERCSSSGGDDDDNVDIVLHLLCLQPPCICTVSYLFSVLFLSTLSNLMNEQM